MKKIVFGRFLIIYHTAQFGMQLSSYRVLNKSETANSFNIFNKSCDTEP